MMAYPNRAAAVNAIVYGDMNNHVISGITTQTQVPLCPWMNAQTVTGIYPNGHYFPQYWDPRVAGQPDEDGVNQAGYNEMVNFAQNNECGLNLEQPTDPAFQSWFATKLAAETTSCNNNPANIIHVTSPPITIDFRLLCIATGVQLYWSNIVDWQTAQMIASKSPLTERLMLFWGNHFVTQEFLGSANAWGISNQMQVMRQNAAGNWKDYVAQMMHDPLLLSFLNQQASQFTLPSSANPNPDPPTANFARELMELFTLGVGTYTENDVLGMARTLSGLTTAGAFGDTNAPNPGQPITLNVYPPYKAANPYNYTAAPCNWFDGKCVKFPWKISGAYDYNPAYHDPGDQFLGDPKNGVPAGTKITTLGQTGNFVPDDAVNLILSYHNDPTKPATSAQFIVRELWNEFISPVPTSPAEAISDPAVDQAILTIAGNFQKDWELKPVLAALFNTPQFWASHGASVKSPAEYIVGIVRTLGLPLDQIPTYINMIANEGQPFYNPPNVRGFLTGVNWINSQTLQQRQADAQTLATLWKQHVNTLVPQVTTSSTTTTVQGKTITTTMATCVPPFSNGYYSSVIVPLELSPGVPPMLNPPAYPTIGTPVKISSTAQQASYEQQCATAWDSYAANMFAQIFSDPAYSLK